MAIARHKDLCIDTAMDERMGRFWAAALGLEFTGDAEAAALEGDTPEQRVRMNVVPEDKTAKNRVPLDVHASSVDDLVTLGATVLEPAAEFGRHWTICADPEGNEFCAFTRS